MLSKIFHIRSLVKGLSWRFVALADTIVVVLFVTCAFESCSLENAVKIGASEFILKFLIFYVHERIWLSVLGKPAHTNREVLHKTISWRIIATLTTFIISGIVLDRFGEIALFIALTELFTKFCLYYIHEKFWLKIPLWKLKQRFFSKKKI
ncbi:MAG: DUF2061 domain-containing protein [Flavobacteriaceae bacterium]|nr:DUF2061 domain-containing protein [Flavobacteriaceae bacterium]